MACSTWTPRSSTEASGRLAKSWMTAIMKAAGAQAIQAMKPASPGSARPAKAAAAEVVATATKAGTAKRLAKGAARETRWKLMTMIGRVNAVAARVIVAMSMSM